LAYGLAGDINALMRTDRSTPSRLAEVPGIYPDELDRLADLRADVIVTHEAPGYHSHGFRILDTLAQSMGARALIHGHHHDRLDSSAEWESRAFASIGVGLCGISSVRLEASVVHVEVIRKGELDDERAGRYRTAWP
jgi:hypothetical protein